MRRDASHTTARRPGAARTAGWPPAGDANTEVGASLINLRDRSRDLLRNNPYASKAITELVGNAVGTGIVPQAKTGTPALDKIIDGEWPYFAENCDPGGQLDFYGMQALIVRTTAESGDGIVRFRQRLSAITSACRSSCTCWRATSSTLRAR